MRFSGATRKLTAFERLVKVTEILPLDVGACNVAADVYTALHRAGTPLEDADLLIASIALYHDAILVTDNERHYRRVSGLKLDN